MPYSDREYMRAYQRVWMRQRRREWLSRNGPCECGSADRLEVHHLDPGQKVSHRIWSWKEQRREAELAKCKILCNLCHKRIHAAKHGSDYKYRIGCRCVDCTAVHRDKQRRYRGTPIPEPLLPAAPPNPAAPEVSL